MGWKFKVIFTAILLVIPLLVPKPDMGKLFELQAGEVLSEALEEALGEFRVLGKTGEKTTVKVSIGSLDVYGPNASGITKALSRKVREWARAASRRNLEVVLTDIDPDIELSAQFVREKGFFDYRFSFQEDNPFAPPPIENKRYFYSWVSLVPPFAAILGAILLERTIIGLFIGAFLGAWILVTTGFFGFTLDLGQAHTIGQFAGVAWETFKAMISSIPSGFEKLFYKVIYKKCIGDQVNLGILGFVVFLSASVGVMTRMGGIQGLMDLLRKKATTLRKTQLATFFMGIAIFFDDYANTIVVGSTMRALTDRLKLAREKLAYIVDSTSAPVAGLSVISTWIAYEVSTFSIQLPEVGISRYQGYSIFVSTLPYRFYCIFTLVLVFLTIVMKREFGPMRVACERALRTGELVRKGGKPMVSNLLTKVAPKEGAPPRPWNALVPLIVLVGTTITGIYVLDIQNVYAILWASMLSFICASFLALFQKILSPKEILISAYTASRALSFAIAILLLAWSIGHVCSELGTAPYLVACFTRVLRPEILPTILFAAGCLISFSTGSSWSTMAILLPNVVVLAWTLGVHSHLGGYGLLLLSIGAVLEGSIFGDHCSPISDTTILSSVASASDHMDHTRTQLPYAFLTMTVALVFGYLPVAFLGRAWVFASIPGGILALIGFLYFIGKDPEKVLDGSISRSTQDQ